eukprot:1145566-Pelagomonas_calceolata.AAC.1
MDPVGKVGRGGWVEGPRFLGTLPPDVFEQFQNVVYFIGFLSSRPVDWHLFGANWMKGGFCVHD